MANRYGQTALEARMENGPDPQGEQFSPEKLQSLLQSPLAAALFGALDQAGVNPQSRDRATGMAAGLEPIVESFGMAGAGRVPEAAPQSASAGATPLARALRAKQGLAQPATPNVQSMPALAEPQNPMYSTRPADVLSLKVPAEPPPGLDLEQLRNMIAPVLERMRQEESRPHLVRDDSARVAAAESQAQKDKMSAWFLGNKIRQARWDQGVYEPRDLAKGPAHWHPGGEAEGYPQPSDFYMGEFAKDMRRWNGAPKAGLVVPTDNPETPWHMIPRPDQSDRYVLEHGLFNEPDAKIIDLVNALRKRGQ